jgi:hypothetical protein
LLKPFFAFSVVWEYFIYFVPEGVAVVGVVEVAEFMDDDVVDDFSWCHHAFPVKI